MEVVTWNGARIPLEDVVRISAVKPIGDANRYLMVMTRDGKTAMIRKKDNKRLFCTGLLPDPWTLPEPGAHWRDEWTPTGVDGRGYYRRLLVADPGRWVPYPLQENQKPA
ncbi:MAG: hypothetical protein ACM3UP_02200 [Methanocella sp.]